MASVYYLHTVRSAIGEWRPGGSGDCSNREYEKNFLIIFKDHTAIHSSTYSKTSCKWSANTNDLVALQCEYGPLNLVHTFKVTSADSGLLDDMNMVRGLCNWN